MRRVLKARALGMPEGDLSTLEGVKPENFFTYQPHIKWDLYRRDNPPFKTTKPVDNRLWRLIIYPDIVMES
jgi:hypothetical protein